MRSLFHIALLLTCLVGSVAFAQTSPSPVVQCWDSERGIVQPVRAASCAGLIVTPDQADRLRIAFERNRLARMARSEAERRAENARPLKAASSGTAFAINDEGSFLTSAHVVQGCEALEARLPQTAARLPVSVKATDDSIDLALLQIAHRSPSFLRFAPHLPLNGEPVALIGFPKEGKIRLTPSLTPVMISFDLSNPDRRGLIGVFGDVRRGHSGGPALDSRGRVIGVLKAKIDSVEAFRKTGATVKHLGVLVDTRRAVRFLEQNRTRYWLDGRRPVEQSSATLFRQGSAAVLRIDCLKSRS